MEAFTPLANPTATFAPTFPEGWADMYPTTSVKYATDWTMMHAQLQKLPGPDGGFKFCSALNALPMACYDFPGRATLFDAASFLSAIELTSEMLITPIEVSTETYSPSEVQEYYYDQMTQMEIKQGSILPMVGRARSVYAPSFGR